MPKLGRTAQAPPRTVVLQKSRRFMIGITSPTQLAAVGIDLVVLLNGETQNMTLNLVFGSSRFDGFAEDNLLCD
jgi:hypothetical protein